MSRTNDYRLDIGVRAWSQDLTVRSKVDGLVKVTYRSSLNRSPFNRTFHFHPIEHSSRTPADRSLRPMTVHFRPNSKVGNPHRSIADLAVKIDFS